MAEKLSNILKETDVVNKSLRTMRVEQNGACATAKTIFKSVQNIRANTICCLLELKITDDMSELSTEDEMLYEEYEGEQEQIKVGMTKDGFYYFK